MGFFYLPLFLNHLYFFLIKFIMATTILLIVLILALSITGVGIYFFWKKVGKPLFKMIDNLNQMSQTMTKGGNKLPDLTLYQKEMMKIQEMLNKHNKAKKK